MKRNKIADLENIDSYHGSNDAANTGIFSIRFQCNIARIGQVQFTYFCFTCNKYRNSLIYEIIATFNIGDHRFPSTKFGTLKCESLKQLNLFNEFTEWLMKNGIQKCWDD